MAKKVFSIPLKAQKSGFSFQKQNNSGIMDLVATLPLGNIVKQNFVEVMSKHLGRWMAYGAGLGFLIPTILMFFPGEDGYDTPPIVTLGLFTAVVGFLAGLFGGLLVNLSKFLYQTYRYVK
jgi:hypothetical protein